MDRQRDGTFAGLVDAEAKHRAAPMSFSIPRSDVRQALDVGSLVKLLFGFERGGRASEERMWVEVTEHRDGSFVGRLDNEPSQIGDLDLDARIAFDSKHVAAVWRDESASAPRSDQFAVVSDRIAKDGALPSRAERSSIPDTQFSGWFIFAADDPETPPPDMAGFLPMSHHELLDRFRIFDSIADEPTGTSWSWDEASLEWTRLT